ncbi:MAG: nucleotide exchange factor GrpE [Patescibacteria group bacterium]
MSKKVKSEDRQIAEELAKEVAELTESLQRERADSMNIRRRYEQQLSSLKSGVKAGVISDLLPAIDNLERALKHAPKDIEGHDYVKGVSGVVKQFEKALTDIGVKKIKTVGEPFNPEIHEAVSMEDEGGDHEIVSEELQPGYTLGEEVIRHAMVKVKKS